MYDFFDSDFELVADLSEYVASYASVAISSDGTNVIVGSVGVTMDGYGSALVFRQQVVENRQSNSETTLLTHSWTRLGSVLEGDSVNFFLGDYFGDA